MKQATVVGIGSPFGADQLGWQIIEELRQHPKLKAWPEKQVQLLYRDRPGVSLIQDLKNSQYAILIDAVDDEAAEPGNCTVTNTGATDSGSRIEAVATTAAAIVATTAAATAASIEGEATDEQRT